MLSPKQVIEDIRQRKRIDSLEVKEDFNKSIEYISESLYTNDIHFVLELIQNADDNKYNQDVLPSLLFKIDKSKILVQNNETGFTEADVRSLCRVGKSTKKKFQGYIGEKGIGFKSVFRVSEEPHIFSNGFRFKLSSKDTDELKYVVPYWVPEIPRYIDTKLTNIILPLKDSVKDELAKKFGDIKPTTILFLNKLKKITIENDYEKLCFEITKVSVNNNILIESVKNGTTGNELWRLIDNTLSVPEDINEEKRKDIRSTHLILAFPLTSAGDAAPSEQEVYAYLPTSSYGFKFIVQADFLLTSDRGSVDEDNKWNRWLRDNIADTFIKAVNAFKDDEKLSRTFYTYIPQENELKDNLFKPVYDQIYAKLQETECIRAQSGKWLKPSDVIYAGSEIRALITNKDALRFFGKEYVSASITIPRPVREKLGIETFNDERLLECLRDSSWVKEHRDNWFYDLYSQLSKRFLESPDAINEIKKMSIIKLESGEVSSTEQSNVFLPLSSNIEYEFEDELHTINKHLYSIILQKQNEIKSQRVLELLDKLNVQTPKPNTIIDYILTIYEDNGYNGWESKPEIKRFGYIKYIKDNLPEYLAQSGYDNGLARIKRSLLIKTKSADNNESSYDYPYKLYLSKEYGNHYGLEDLFIGADVFYVDDYYLHDANFPSHSISLDKQSKVESKNPDQKINADYGESIKDWKYFFIKIGINESPRVIRHESTDRSKHPTIKDNKSYKEEKIVDWKLSPEFDTILHAGYIDIARRIIQILDEQWEEKYSKYSKLIFDYYQSRSWHSKTFDSSFINELKNHLKIPTTDGRLMEPSQVYLNSKDLVDILGDTVPYTAVDLLNSDLVEILGLKKVISTNEVLNNLRRIIKAECKDLSVYRKHYLFLQNNFSKYSKDIRDAFSEEALIYVPLKEANDKIFFKSGEIVWESAPRAFSDNQVSIFGVYPELEQFFILELGVRKRVDIKFYCNYLKGLSKENTLSTDDENTILKIYEDINNYIKIEKNLKDISEEKFWQEFISGPILLTSNDRLEANSDTLFFNDNEMLYDLFKNESSIIFIKISAGRYPKVQKLMDTLNIHTLSKSVTPRLAQQDMASCSNGIVEQVKSYQIYILRYLYRFDQESYEYVKTNGIVDQLNNIACFTSDSFYVDYELNGIVKQAEQPILLFEGNIYIEEGYYDDVERIVMEISKLFKTKTMLDDFILALIHSDDRIDDYLALKNITELPISEFEIFGNILTYHPSINQADSGDNDKHKIEDRHDEWKPGIEISRAPIKMEQFVPREKYPANGGLLCDSDESELSTDIKETQKIGNNLSAREKKKIGRFGEEYAVKCLKDIYHKKYPGATLSVNKNQYIFSIDGLDVVKITWLNWDSDIGEGHDIKLAENGVENYIEVKTTTTDNEEWLDVSSKQWAYAKKYGCRYHLYRVYNAGTKDMRMKIISDPYKLAEEDRISSKPFNVKIKL